MTPDRAARLVLGLALAACSLGCMSAKGPGAEPPGLATLAGPSKGPAQGPGGAPAPMHPGPITEVDALMHDLDVAEGRLNVGLERAAYEWHEIPEWRENGPQPAPAPEQPTNVPPPPAPPPQPSAAPVRPARPGGPKDVQASEACAMACRALASMQRSADGICRLVEPGDDRCGAARGRVARAKERVVAAGCVCFEHGF